MIIRVIVRRLLYHHGGVAVECDVDDGEGIVALLRHGLQVAGETAVDGSVMGGAQAAGDFLPDSGHTAIAPGLLVLVGEWVAV